MNYARFLTAVSGARKPSPIRMLSEYLSQQAELNLQVPGVFTHVDVQIVFYSCPSAT